MEYLVDNAMVSMAKNAEFFKVTEVGHPLNCNVRCRLREASDGSAQAKLELWKGKVEISLKFLSHKSHVSKFFGFLFLGLRSWRRKQVKILMVIIRSL